MIVGDELPTLTPGFYPNEVTSVAGPVEGFPHWWCYWFGRWFRGGRRPSEETNRNTSPKGPFDVQQIHFPLAFPELARACRIKPPCQTSRL